MKNIEIIEIKLSNNRSEQLENVLEEVIAKIRNSQTDYFVKLYRRMNLKTDYMVMILYTQKIDNKLISELGQRLKIALNEFGIINHKIWNEIM